MNVSSKPSRLNQVVYRVDWTTDGIPYIQYGRMYAVGKKKPRLRAKLNDGTMGHSPRDVFVSIHDAIAAEIESLTHRFCPLFDPSRPWTLMRAIMRLRRLMANLQRRGLFHR